MNAAETYAEAALNWFLRLLGICALVGFALAVWFAGPMIRYGDSRPLASEWTRAAIIAASLVLVGCRYFLAQWRSRRSERKIEEAISRSEAAGSDAEILETRMRDAISTLKRLGSRRTFLYQLPWYIVIGPPGAGKTTALINSGLDFPLAMEGEAQAVGGVGGTRNCDWWFTDEAVLIDTAGRYTTQESDLEADRKSWLAFLSILKRYRPRRPVNGVILAISLSDLMTLEGSELGTHVAAIRTRLAEIGNTLNIECPVYVLFTKADLIIGFREYFGHFDEARRKCVWGRTFSAAGGAPDLHDDIVGSIRALAGRLSQEAADRMQEEIDPAARGRIFAFPAQLGLLAPRIADFMSAVFGGKGESRPPNLRGFYFSSGTQEGTPIDQLLGSMGRTFSVGAPQMSGTGKSFFLHDLLTRVVFSEAPLVSYDRAAERRARMGRLAFNTAACLLLVGGLAAIGLSFLANKSMADATLQMMSRYEAAARPVLVKPVTEPDLEQVAEPLEMLRDLPVGYANRTTPATWQAGFGLSQHDALLSASENAYRVGLENMLRPRLLLQLEDAIRRNLGNPERLYEPLKVYMMLGGAAPGTHDNLVVSWITRDWLENRFPGPGNRDGRQGLERHLRAMLALDDAYDPTYKLDDTLVAAARRSINRMSFVERAQAILTASLNRNPLPAFPLGAQAGREARLVFDTTDGTEISQLSVPGLYTREGFERTYLPQLAAVAKSIIADEWVFGNGERDPDADLSQVGPALLQRYAADFVAAWNTALGTLRFRPLAAGGPQYLSLAAVSATDSPLRQLFEAVAAQTWLARPGSDAAASSEAAAAGAAPDMSSLEVERGLARIGIDTGAGKSQSRAGAAMATAAGVVPGANIDAQFRPFHILVEGRPGQRPIDALVQNFHDIYQSLLMAAASSGAGSRGDANLPMKLQSLRLNASRLPKVLASLVLSAADEFEGNAAKASLEQLNRTLAQNVTAPCHQALDNRYPFAPGASAEVPLSDFARLFAPGGVIDRYFAQNLAPLIDISGKDWKWRHETLLGRDLSSATLRQFQLAADIRDAFFRQGESMPAIRVAITPTSLNADIDMALLSVDGQIVQGYQSGSSESTVTWPGGATGSANLSFTPALPGRQSVLGFQGAWAIRRLLEAGNVTPNGDGIDIRFVIGGRDAAFRIRAEPGPDPFLLPALSQFTCPAGF